MGVGRNHGNVAVLDRDTVETGEKARNDSFRAVCRRKKSDFRRHVRAVFAIKQSAPTRLGREKKRREGKKGRQGK